MVKFLSQKDCRRHKKIDCRLGKSRLEVSIKWTPGHADKRGNCIADELAKEAAEEAKSILEDKSDSQRGRFQKIGKGIMLHEIATIFGCFRYGSNLVQLQADCVVKDPSIHAGPLYRRTKGNFSVEAWLYFE